MYAEHSKVCCTVPAVVSKEYQEKGEWITVDGMKTYVVGPATAKHAIIYIFDIFGFTSQSLQGADIVATSSPKPYLVVMPDYFDGDALNIAEFPPSTEEQKANMNKLVEKIMAFDKMIPRFNNSMKKLEEMYPGVEKWAALGFCWGGKICALTSQEGTPFAAIVQSSPSRLDLSDATKCVIPMAVLASKDEDKELVQKFDENFKVKKHVEIFDSQTHGWMCARADLKDEKVKSQYERGYKLALEFFNEHL